MFGFQKQATESESIAQVFADALTQEKQNKKAEKAVKLDKETIRDCYEYAINSWTEVEEYCEGLGKKGDVCFQNYLAIHLRRLEADYNEFLEDNKM